MARASPGQPITGQRWILYHANHVNINIFIPQRLLGTRQSRDEVDGLAGLGAGVTIVSLLSLKYKLPKVKYRTILSLIPAVVQVFLTQDCVPSL